MWLHSAGVGSGEAVHSVQEQLRRVRLWPMLTKDSREIWGPEENTCVKSLSANNTLKALQATKMNQVKSVPRAAERLCAELSERRNKNNANLKLQCNYYVSYAGGVYE
jgi:hypothetical protein